MDFTITFTQAQYDRYKAAYKGLMGLVDDPTDAELAGQMKREARAITYAWEIDNNGGNPETWVF